jgi:hypothetical protein
VSHGAQKVGDPKAEQQKLQFDYAWKWFSFHADQRTKVFNFMLIVFGVFAAGLVNALDKNLPKAAVVGLSFFAAILAILFSQLDRRNRDLVWLAEDILKQLERDIIFPHGKAPILDRRDPSEWSWAPAQIMQGLVLGRHRVLLPLIAYLIAAAFFAAGVLLWVYWNPHPAASPLVVKILP